MDIIVTRKETVTIKYVKIFAYYIHTEIYSKLN